MNFYRIELWKTDSTSDYAYTLCEIEASSILDHSNVSHVKYRRLEHDDRLISVCECIANDDISLIDAFELRDWCNHTGRDFLSYVESHFKEDISKLVVSDYVLANTDRHLGNIFFVINNNTNMIAGLAPAIDYNQALLSYKLGTDDKTLIYDLTGLSMQDSAKEYFASSNIKMDTDYLPEKANERYRELIEFEKK